MIYAIHKLTKEHVITRRGESWPSKEWDLVQDIGDGWIAWRGESRDSPLPDVHNFDYMVRSGEVVEGKWASYWAHTGTASDIIAYRPLLDEPSEPEADEWDGDGLPPVGCECEFEYLEVGCWVPARVVGYDGAACVVALDGDVYVGSKDPSEFRPIRSEADRAVEAMLALDDYNTESYNSGMMSRDDFCRALYRAGYRKS